MSKLALHHLFYTAAIIFNIVTVCVYWTLIHKGNMINLKKQGIYCRILQQVTVHITPGIACLVNSVITKSVLTRKLLKPLLYFGIFYLFVNFLQVKISGLPVYAFLTWEDSSSYILVACLQFGFAIIYIILCMIDEYFK